MSAETEEADDLMFIDDARVPEEIREQAAQFRTPVVYAAWGGSDWILFGEDGKVVDICSLTLEGA